MWQNIDYVFQTTAILIAFLLYLALNYIKRPANLPPGPKGIPFVGYLPFLGKNPHITLTKLRKIYGEIFTIYLGSERLIVLSSHKLINEALVRQGNIFAERPDYVNDSTIFNSETGMFSTSGEPRIKMRRFTLTTLRNFGMGKSALEPHILDEIDCLVNEIKKLQGKPTVLRDLLAKSVVNVLCTIMIGKRMKYEDENFQILLSLARKFVATVGVNQIALYLPKFIQKLFRLQTSAYAGTALYKKISEVVENHKSNQTCSQESFIDAWRAEAEKLNSNPNIFNDQRLTSILTELYIAGSDSTNLSIEWALLYLIKYPEVQQKMQIEIDTIIGKERMPSMIDLKLMPYTDAVIMELNRITTIAALAAPHSTSEDTTLNGYFIPKKTTVIPNLWAVHMNPEVFPEPKIFKPERFLTEDNQVKRLHELIPFSIGKRQCPGEALARMEVYLYLVSLLQYFTFTMEGDVIFGCEFGGALEPIPQKMCANLR